MSNVCVVCKEEIVASQFVSVPGGGIHTECFYCPVCKKNLANEKGYLPFKGNFLCNVRCRAAAMRDPDVLLQNTLHWKVTQDAKGGWERQDGKEAEPVGADAGNRSDPTMQPKLAEEAANIAASKSN